jgi:iron complex transport system substrate-binding protein
MRSARTRLRVLVALAAFTSFDFTPSAWGAGNSTAPLTVVDDLGQKIVLAHPAERIVSLAPSATEMLFAAGAGSRVIATVEYADAPDAAKRIPRIGNYEAIDLERLVRAHPDVVVAWPTGNNPAQLARIASLKLPIYQQLARTLEELAPSLRRLGALTATSAVADPAARQLELELTALRARFAHREPLTVFMQVWDHPLYTIGGTQLLSDALRLCGARNVFADLHEAAPAVSIEAVVARDPQVIVATAQGTSSAPWLEEWRRFPQLSAVRSGKLFAIDDPRLVRLGPSVVPATESLCELLERARAR